MSMDRIMVATDSSSGTDRVEAAAALAKAVDGELLIVPIGRRGAPHGTAGL